MKEIPVSKRNLIIAVLLGVALAVGILAIENWPLPSILRSPSPTGEDGQASSAAVSAVQTVFQVDYQEGKQAWLARICAASTPAGCQLFTISADRMWQKYGEAQSVVTAAVQPVQKVAENDTEQVWQMAVTLSSPLPGSNKTHDTAYVALVKTEDGWKLDRFLMEPEIQVLLKRQLPTGTPAQEGSQP